MMTSAQVVRAIRMHQPAELALLLGAGASKSSGVALASEMIAEWRSDLFDADATPDEHARLDPQAWLAANRAKYPWFEQDSEYSKLFELQYRNRSRRQKYIEQKVEGVRPGWGYLYLANIIVSARYFTTIFTTNFDDLINDALSTFLRHNAVVCSADAQVDQISFLSDRAKIIKLHGDYLFADILNTEEELRIRIPLKPGANWANSICTRNASRKRSAKRPPHAPCSPRMPASFATSESSCCMGIAKPTPSAS